MKFTCEKENLERYLNIAERFSGKNLTLPILSNIMLETVGNNIKLTATNLEQAIQVNINGKILREGKICIPAKTINSFIQSLKEDKLDLEEKQNILILKTLSKEAKINGLISEDFPLIPSIKKNFSLNIDAQKLKSGLEKVLPAVAISDFKPEFTGVYFNFNSQGELKLAATDTFRLAEETINLGSKVISDNISFIIPQIIGRELTKVIDQESEIKISLGDNQIVFEIGEIKITSRLIDGSFPEYSSIIPKNFESSAFVNKNELKDIVRTASIFSSKLSDIILEFQDKEIKIKSLNSDLGEYKTSISAKMSEGSKNVRLSFNYHYLLDGLNSLGEEDIFIGCNTENSPSMFKNKSGKSFTYVLMPIKLN